MPVTPAGLHVPISREERMRAIDARTEKMEAELDDPQAEALERELRTIDDRLRVRFISPRAGDLHPRARAPGVIPGRWHVKLLTEPRNAYFALCGPDWTYAEPGLYWVERFKERDLWRRGALEEIRKAEEDQERARVRQALLEKEQREDEVALAYRAAKRVAGDGGEHKRRWGAGFSDTSDSGLLLPTGV